MGKMYRLWASRARDCPTQLRVHACASVCARLCLCARARVAQCAGALCVTPRAQALCFSSSPWPLTLPASDSSPIEHTILTHFPHGLPPLPRVPACTLSAHPPNVDPNPTPHGEVLTAKYTVLRLLGRAFGSTVSGTVKPPTWLPAVKV